VRGQLGFQPLLPPAWINAWLGLEDTDGTIQPASVRGDGLWPPPAYFLTVRTGPTFMAEKAEPDGALSCARPLRRSPRSEV
jgi:hypothetical protein